MRNLTATVVDCDQVITGVVTAGDKGDKGDQGPPVPVAHELGDDPELAVSQKLLTDSIADMEQSNSDAVLEATHQAGLAGDSAVIAVDQAGIAAIKAGEASSSAVDAADSEAAAEQAATIATTKADEASQSAAAAAAVVTGGTASLTPEPGKIPLADDEGKIDVNWLGADVAGLPALISRYIRSTPFTPWHVFSYGEKGFWVDPSDASTLFQNSDGTIAVVDGDPIGLVLDKTGNNYNLTQTVSASRPKLLNGGMVFDKVDDSLKLEVPAGGITGTLFLATTRGTASYGVSMPAGVWTLGNEHNPLGDVVSAVLVDRLLTEEEKARLHVFGIGKGGTEFGVETTFVRAFQGWTHLVDFPLIDVSNGTNFQSAWLGCSGLTSFPELDVSNGTNFQSAWYDCSGLTSFPELDVSNGTNFQNTWFRCSSLTSFPELDVSSGTNFTNAWYGCSGLTSFPANFFDNCLATGFFQAFLLTNLSQESIDGILVSINSNGTSNGRFNQSGGSAPSSVGQAAIEAMRSRGWTVTTTGGY